MRTPAAVIPTAMTEGECPLLAQSGHSTTELRCPLSGVKRTFLERTSMSAIDPKRTFRIQILTWIKFRVVRHELSFNDGLAFCKETALVTFERRITAATA